MNNQRTNCINCGGPLEPGVNKCIYCGTANVDGGSFINLFFKNKKFRVTALYPILLILGIAIAIYIYGFAFDDFSETELVSLTPLWFFFIIFGFYGYFAEYLMKKVISHKGGNLSDAYKRWTVKFLKLHLFLGVLGMIFLLPFAFIRTRNSLLIAFAGSALWGILLLIFFQAIFPAL
jgi:hypothetical protein